MQYSNKNILKSIRVLVLLRINLMGKTFTGYEC